MKLRYTEKDLNRILNLICDIMRPYIDKESLELETTVQGEKEKNNLNILRLLKEVLSNKFAKEENDEVKK